MKKWLPILLILFFVNSLCLHAQKKTLELYNLEDDVAIQGYDPVSYFNDDGPQKGKSSLTERVDGAVYYFTNEENKVAFQQDRDKYLPAYGGWCAYAMGADGSKVKIDPETYKILDGKLYLFYNFYFTNTLKKWNKDEMKLKKSADDYWDEILTN